MTALRNRTMSMSTTYQQLEDFLHFREEGQTIVQAAKAAGVSLEVGQAWDARARRTRALHAVNGWLDRHKRRDDYDLEAALDALDSGWNVIMGLAQTF